MRLWAAPLLALALAGSARAQDKVFAVDVETRLRIGADSPLEGIRLWHALPSGRRGLDHWQPPDGSEGRYAPLDSEFVYWERDSLEPGTLTFRCQFEVPSQLRAFPPEAMRARWEDFEPAPPPATSPLELRQLAQQVRASMSPGAAVREFTRWVQARLQYVPVTPYPQTDLETTLREGKGHCGHYASLFCELCRLVGIPVRLVGGLNLYAPDGVASAPFPNIHAWTEVRFPDSGWLEVDPYLGPDGMQLPPRLVENNRWFQNGSLWVKENGKWRPHRWTYRDGQLQSEVGMEQRITYRVVEGDRPAHPWFDWTKRARPAAGPPDPR